ncbi:transcriptional regulator with XRE-family HTH domain [Streptomyces tendae]|uniref:helix-turn-helix domain-containing protein n=1 Tax=Streptomyces tendae TaxID=1932 RepID=UPI003836F875
MDDEQRLPVRRRGRGPAAVKAGPPEVMAFAHHLRGLQDALGLTQDELARKLHVSPSTLSRHLAGERVPEREMVRDIYILAGESADLDYPDGDFAASLEMLYLAKKHKDPLIHRVWVGELAQKSLENEILATKARISDLRQELRDERMARQEAEEKLGSLTAAPTAEKRNLLEELEVLRCERDEARAKIHELEDEIRQFQALLPLLQEDQKRVEEAHRRTAQELARHHEEPTDAVSELDESSDAILRAEDLYNNGDTREGDELLLAHMSELDPGRSLGIIDDLRDRDRYAAAHRLLVEMAERRPVGYVVDLLLLLADMESETDVRTIFRGASRGRRGVEFARFVNAVSENRKLPISSEEVLSEFARMFEVERVLEAYPFMDRSLRADLLEVAFSQWHTYGIATVIDWIVENDPEFKWRAIIVAREACNSRGNNKELRKDLMLHGWGRSDASVVLPSKD